MKAITISSSLLLCLWWCAFSATTTTTTSAFVVAFNRPSTAVLKKSSKQPSKPVTSLTTRKAAAAASVASSEGGANKDGSSIGQGTATIPAEVFNLVKGIVGAGVLALPAGIATFGDAPSAAIPALALISSIGFLSAYGFGLIGRVCALTNTDSYRSAWSASVSERSSWIPAWSVTLKTCFAVLAYSMILADTFQGLLSALFGLHTLGKPAVLLGLTSFILLPLCLLKNLSSLAPFSLLGSLGMIYTAIAMTIRYLGQAYTVTGPFGADLPATLRPAFGSIGASGVLNPKSAILIGMLSTAYMAHFNAPQFYTELKDNTVPRYLTVVSTSFAISVAIFAVMAAVGFLTFGANCSGVILNNYSPKDALMAFSKIAVALSLVFSYPLAFTGARNGIFDLLKVKNKTSTRNFYGLSLALLSAITGAALIIPDVSFVLAFAGSTLGNGLIYVFPALMFRGAVKKLKNPSKLQKLEVKLALCSAAAGLGMGVVGAIKAVQSIL